jgi:hypothetical protein
MFKAFWLVKSKVDWSVVLLLLLLLLLLPLAIRGDNLNLLGGLALTNGDASRAGSDLFDPSSSNSDFFVRLGECIYEHRREALKSSRWCYQVTARLINASASYGSLPA